VIKKNIQVIDGANNSMYPVYIIIEKDFLLIFPNEQDVEFIEDFVSRIGNTATKILKKLWEGEMDKKSINGIHGTLFYELSFKKKHYPSKKESEAIVVLNNERIEGRKTNREEYPDKDGNI
jgi:hypothetical protein